MLTTVLIFTGIILFTCGLLAIDAIAKHFDDGVNNRD